MDEELELDIPAEEENEEVETEEESEESIETLRAKLEEERQAREKAETAFNDQKRRAEKAEKSTKPAPKPSSDNIPSTDLYALMQSNVPQEDINDVLEYAKLKKITVADALKSNVVKTILSDNAEMRKTAEVASTGNARRVATKVSPDALLNKARSGDLPEDDDSIARLVEANMEASRGNRR